MYWSAWMAAVREGPSKNIQVTKQLATVARNSSAFVRQATGPATVLIVGPTGAQTVGLVTTNITNTFSKGSLKITKVVNVAADAIQNYGVGPFQATVTCTWKKGTQTTGSMQQARVAFERMTRNISQATLNTYYSYFYASGATAPSYYMRQSELEFMSGNGPVGGSTFISGTVGGAQQITHAIFFQAPLGVTNPSNTASVASYGSLSKNSASSEAAAERALQASTPPEQLAAFKVMYDYHLSRAVGPIIPTWIWKIRKDELNQTWKEHRNGTVTT